MWAGSHAHQLKILRYPQNEKMSFFTSINLRYIFKQNAVFPYSFLLSFVDFIKAGISNKP
ncbi:hypothetical protein FOA24_09460 [Bacillus thuringiensis]